MTFTSETQSINKNLKEKLRQLRISFYKNTVANHLSSVRNANTDRKVRVKSCVYWATAAETLQCCYMTAAYVSYQPDSLPLSLVASPGKKVLHQWRNQQMRAWSRQLPNIQTLSLFICFLMTPRCKPRGRFHFRFKEKKVPIFPVDHLSLAHQSQGAMKVSSPHEMDAFESFHFNTNKCLCHSCLLWHTAPHIFVTVA